MSTKIETKKCGKCPEGKNIKPLTEFSTCNGRYRSFCKKCMNELSRQYKQKNKKKISKYNHNYNKNNRKAIQERQTSTRNMRKINDFGFFISTELRSKLNSYIKSNFRCETKFMEKLLGCESEIFMIWLIYLFTDGMSFSNYGTYWTIDHVDPVSNYDLTNSDDITLCFYWMNLRPLLKLDNQKKTNKININDQNNHIDLMKKFKQTILPKFKTLTN